MLDKKKQSRFFIITLEFINLLLIVENIKYINKINSIKH